MKSKKKLIVIACIVLVFIASIDATEKETKKKKKKSKKSKNVQSDAAPKEPQAQQPTYPEYAETYDDNYDYEENDSGELMVIENLKLLSEKEVEIIENIQFWKLLSLYALIL